MGQFKFVQKDTLTRDIKKIVAPDDSVLTVLGVEFKYLTQDEWSALTKEKGNDVLFDIVLGWDSFADGAGNELEFSEAALASLLGQQFVLVAVFDAFVNAISGGDRKNLSASLALGLAAKAQQAQRAVKTKPKRKRS